MFGLYDDAMSAGADEAEAEYRAATREAERRWSIDHDEAPEAHDIGWQLTFETSREAIEQAVRRRDENPPPCRIVGLWQADADGKWQLIADYRGDAAPDVEQAAGPAEGPAARGNRVSGRTTRVVR